MADDPQADLLLCDGSHLFWRAASAASLTADGTPTGGIYAFIRALIRVHKRFDGVIIVCWEGGRRSEQARRKIYPPYKRRDSSPERDATMEVMFKQSDQLVKLLGSLGIAQAKAPGWEADDTMATLAHRASKQGHKVGIFSGDSDMYQCVNDNVFVIRPLPKTIEIVNSDGVQERLGVRPNQVPLLKALAGDRSDGIPGVNGIGNKGAAGIVGKLKSIVNVITAAKADQKPAVPRFGDKAWGALRRAAADGELELWWKLARVNRRARVEITWNEYDGSAVLKELIALKFRSMLRLRERDQLRRLSGTSE